MFIVWLPVTLAAAAEPKLVEEKRIFPAGDQGWNIPGMLWCWVMRLSPDGKHLLYTRELPAADPQPPEERERREPSRQLRLRDLESGKEVSLPLDPIPDGWTTVYTRFNFFDPAGRTLALPVVARTEERRIATGGARLTSVRRTMRLVLYDVAAGKVTKTALEAGNLMAKFDRTGRGLVLCKDMMIHTASLPELKLTGLGATGYPNSICPTADVAVLFVPPSRTVRPREGARPERPRSKLMLHDLRADKPLAELPSEEPSSNWDDWECQWTSDGRYLYYPGAKKDTVQTPQGPRQRTATLSLVWDRLAGRQVHVIDAAVAVGPGPTPTSMVLCGLKDEPKGVFLHDAATGQRWTLEPGAKAQHARGGKVVYTRASPDGAAAYVARIAMPTAAQ
ncbi:MAG: hypothetical protein AMJ81_10575 [Phycisphaerae bacterium SM23_33]|nr:MAG: hypothetical protein AMJ81_10575 [Phycisphaerae bacterium SM23_33]